MLAWPCVLSLIPYTFKWRPKKPGRYFFCVQAADKAGNKSKLDCRPFKVKPA